ncbi:hypothetical protein NM208_g7398 [Fusarium decemcellulare]|uniref:Uncharacterized protein n=1 Tax=Fusarium decemcellulare TaxID=57161 RepID=A0ACC1S9C7_9HYPO|nr:hypothetical protein NM208_g7398 [Fusarium decemcellulare]
MTSVKYRSADDGAKPFAANLSTEGVICIGGAREPGHVDEASKDVAEFVFPGESMGIEHPPDLDAHNPTHRDKFNNSIATARASGFCALIMTLVEMRTLKTGAIAITVEELRRELRKSANIRLIFDALITDDQATHTTSVVEIGLFLC